LSALMNKPLLAISYHPKIDVLMADLGQGKYCLQIEDFEVEKAKCLFSQIENESQTIMQQISQRVASYQVALDEQYKRLFAS
jgi:polysaccharide pyruvyl transferase WcaK-like protein